MKNILYICNKDPRIITGGNEQRTNLLWKALQKLGNVYTIVYNDTVDEKQELVGDINPIYNVPIKEAYYNHTVKGIAYAILYRIMGFCVLPYKYPNEYNPAKLYSDVKFDIVVTRYAHSATRYHLWEIAPIFVDIDDHPVQVYETVKQSKLPCIFRPLFKKILFKQYKSFINKISGGWIANKEQSGDGGKISFLPNIPFMPSEKYDAYNVERSYLFTIGAMTYGPNRDGVDRFLSEIWPAFHEKYPNINYVIGGKGVPKQMVEKWNRIDGVKYVGFIDDLEGAYKKCYATIVPIYAGGGTCIKTLESLAHSRVCLSTRFGARGLNAKANTNIGLLVFNDTVSFIKAFEEIQNNIRLINLETQAKMFVINEYSTEIFNRIVLETIKKNIC